MPRSVPALGKQTQAYANDPLGKSLERQLIPALREYIAAKLPEFMVPNVFITLDRLPQTVNGKLDRRALPAPEISTGSNAEYEPPQGELEERLSRIWQELLRVDRVGRGDNFFELGGHSLLAVRLLSRIREVLGREVSLRELFEHPTLEGLGGRLSEAGASSLSAIERADRSVPLPLSWSQQRLWFIDQLEGAGASYHIPGAIRLHGELDRSALQRALDTIVERHESLRTVFAKVQGEAVQVIQAQAGFALQVLDLTEQPAAQREEAVKRQAAEEAHAGFDLGGCRRRSTCCW
jgi:aryl carrier-like protein